MNEDFITNGLEADRYLKADKLVQQFRNQIREEIEEISEQIIDANPVLFGEDVSLDYGAFGVENSRTLTTIRVEYDLHREHEEYGTCLLNIGLEWVDPDEQDGSNSPDRALCYVLYKIQRGSDTRFKNVKDRTAESDRWDAIRFGEDQWPYKRKESPGIVYIPVESGSEIAEGLRTLKEHFSEEYAPELRD
jgi:hypothetical protein